MADRNDGLGASPAAPVASRMGFWKHFLLVLAVPAGEYFLFRWLLRNVLGIKIGFPLGLTDYDLVLPGLAALFVFLWTTRGERVGPVAPASLNRRVLEVHLVTLALWLGSALVFPDLLSETGHPVRVGWLGLSLVLFGSGLALFLPAAAMRAQRSPVLVAVFLVAGCNVVSKVALAPLWPLLNRVTGWILCSAFSPALSLTCSYRDAHAWLVHPAITVAVGVGCSGMEGIFFFLSLAFFAAVSFWRKLRPRAWLGFVAFGVLAMYLTNLVRIAFFTLAATAIAQWQGAAGVRSWYLGLLHDFGGWPFYFLTLAVYFRFAFAPRSPRLPRPALGTNWGLTEERV